MKWHRNFSCKMRSYSSSWWGILAPGTSCKIFSTDHCILHICIWTDLVVPQASGPCSTASYWESALVRWTSFFLDKFRQQVLNFMWWFSMLLWAWHRCNEYPCNLQLKVHRLGAPKSTQARPFKRRCTDSTICLAVSKAAELSIPPPTEELIISSSIGSSSGHCLKRAYLALTSRQLVFVIFESIILGIKSFLANLVFVAFTNIWYVAGSNLF